jgi:1-deoxy-D-xylulose-5-phosphate synthase
MKKNIELTADEHGEKQRSRAKFPIIFLKFIFFRFYKKQNSTSLLTKINSPQDLKKLKPRELNQLAGEIRERIISAVASNGGHLASNLGVVELSVALHRVFDSPQDKIVWDVGHQCYAHKLLTGRFEDFPSLRRSGGLAGFPKRSESVHDAFNTGHASTSISAALGLLAAERILGGKGHAVAVIGDGALTGGLAYEALSHAGHLGLPLIVILNDNKMSISANVGGLSKYLSRLSMKRYYQIFRRHFDAMAKKIPFFGEAFFNLVLRLKRAVKAVFYIDNFFVDLGFEYVGPIKGHNIAALTGVLEDARNLNRPVVIHVNTRKGKGYGFAEGESDSYHGVGPFSPDSGIVQKENSDGKKTFTESFSSALLAAAHRDKRVAALTAAMQKGTGLSGFAQAFPGRFFDVGIAEGHAATFAAGLAARGLKPVAAVYSTFIQRAADQVIHDAALQKLPVIFALDRAGFVGDDGETHQGLFDIALFRSAPNMTIMAPASGKEMLMMLDWALDQQGGPVIIRYPKAFCPEETPAFSLPLEAGRGVWLSQREGKKQVCLAFTGSLYREAAGAAAILQKRGISAHLYNLRFLKPVDEDYLAGLMNEYEHVSFIEEGMKAGGFGEYAAALAKQRGCACSVAVLAAESRFLEEERALGTREELLAENGLDGIGIAEETFFQYGQLLKTAKMVYDKSQ